jgi:GNAT superfamily N-acetyltransferase
MNKTDIVVKHELNPSVNSYHYHTAKAYEYGPIKDVGLKQAVPGSLTAFVPKVKEPVGGLYCYAVFDFVVIEAMWVKPEFQNRGIGRELLLEARVFAKQFNATRILASTMEFHGAMPFLKKAGFEIVGEVENCPKGSRLFYIQIRLA